MRTLRIMMLSAPLAVALMAAPVLAHGPHGGGACRQDLQQLCPNVTPGPGAFASCLACPTPGPGTFASCLQSAAVVKGIKLSDQCQAQLTKMQANIAAWQACKAAPPAACSGDTGKAFMQCLRGLAKSGTLPEGPCQPLLAQHHGHHHHCHPTQTPE